MVCKRVSLPACLPARLSAWLAVCLSICLSVYNGMERYVCLHVSK